MFPLMLTLACQDLPDEGSLDTAECGDGFDNDEDGLVDCAEEWCAEIRSACDEDTEPPRDSDPVTVIIDSPVDSELHGDPYIVDIGWRGQSDARFDGWTELYVTEGSYEYCAFTWDTVGLGALSDCEDCSFAWTYAHEAGRSENLGGCQIFFPQLEEDYPLAEASRGFAPVWTNPYSGTAYENVLMQYFGSPYFDWYGIAYADYGEEGVLSYDWSRGPYYYY